MTRSNETLKKENETLDAYLQRHVSVSTASEHPRGQYRPALSRGCFELNKHAILFVLVCHPLQPEEADEWADEDNRRGRKGKGRKFRVTALTIDQKLDIGTAELDAIKKEAHSFEAQSSRMIDALKV